MFFHHFIQENNFLTFHVASLDNDTLPDGRMDDLRFYLLFNNISVISGRCLDDNERLCAMELCFGRVKLL